MPKHEVSLNIHTKIVSHKDVEVEVKSDNQKLGTLLISKGNIEWLPSNNHVNKYRMSWEKFAKLMELEGHNVKM
ncbi:MAG: hypothetical protein ACRCT3_06545 [Aeromonas hydrophila]